MIETVDRKGEYAVVTGGNRGIGWYTVKGLADSGMNVIVGKNFLMWDQFLKPKFLLLYI